MSTKLLSIMVFASCITFSVRVGAENPSDARQAIVQAFEGTHRFNYLFVENGNPYFNESWHLQLIEVRENKEQQTTEVFFYNPTKTGKSLHFSYVIQANENNVTVKEFDSNGKHRFDCVGTYQPDTRLLQCVAKKAPKPARDLDSPLTRRIGLFKRPTSWPEYDALDRHNTFRFYDWGFVHMQENVKVDASGKTVARETGVISALRVKSPAGSSTTRN